MTFWINQHVVETKERIIQWRTNRTINAHAQVDHVELAGSHTILGLIVGWENRTENPITVVEIQVILYKKGQVDILLNMLPLERFGRQDNIFATDLGQPMHLHRTATAERMMVGLQ